MRTYFYNAKQNVIFLLFRLPFFHRRRENTTYFIHFLFFLLAFLTPCDTILKRCTRTIVAYFHQPGCLLVFRISPVVPSLWTDMLIQEAVYENRLPVRSPRTAKEHLVYAVGRNDSAFVKDELII